MAIKKVQIGKSDVYSTPMGLGTNAVGGRNLFPNLDLKDETGIATVKAALDHGITQLDTAFVYGLGHSEELIGQAIKGYDRSKIVIATKGSQIPESGGSELSNDPKFLVEQVENSLKRLGTDYVDIYYIHFPDTDTPKAEAVGALEKLKEQGKIRAIGVSNFSLSQIKAANADGYVDIVEDQYSLVHPMKLAEIGSYLKEKQISFVPYFPLASGLLTGKYTSETKISADDARATNPNFVGERYEQILAAVDKIRPIADNHKANVAQIVLAWYMKNPQVGIVIPGAKHPEQVVANAKAMNIELSGAEYDQIEQAFSKF